jgi:hypothetical protein
MATRSIWVMNVLLSVGQKTNLDVRHSAGAIL